MFNHCKNKSVAALATAGLALCAQPAPGADAPLFNRDIRPILSDNCFLCHGPDSGTRKAGLRLDLEDRAKAKVIVAGKPEESPLIQRLTTQDQDDVMPPPKTGKKLAPRQVELLRQWIAQGAPWEAHWAYFPVSHPQAPSPAASQSVARNEIDRFILARLAKEKIEPAPEADRRTLLRRLSFDLTGLPPKPADVSAFEADPSATACENLVDRLLASPHYGERMAVWWLDLVRYADSVGYHGDQLFSVWPFRDYVIDAFNRNVPFDQFTREQLGGDLLPNPTRSQKVASGYNRLGMMSAEGGVQDKEYRAKYASERVRNVAGTWMGATMTCAECHDHKFDPYTTRDFYRMAAFFADLKEYGFYPAGFQNSDWGPSLRLPTEEQQQRLAELEAELAATKKAAAAIPDESLAAPRAQWELQALAADAWGTLGWQPAKPTAVHALNGARLEVRDSTSIVASGPNPDHETYVVTMPAELPRVTALRLEVLTDGSLPGNDISRSGQTFVLSEVEVLAMTGTNVCVPWKIAHVTADFEVEGFPALALIDGRRETGWAQGGGPPGVRRAVFHFAEPVRGGTNVAIQVRLRHESRFTRHALGRFRLALSSVNWRPTEHHGVPDDVLRALNVAPDKRDAAQRQLLERHYRRIAPELAGFAGRQAHLEAERSRLLGDIPVTLVAESTAPRPIRVLARGNWMDESGDVVEPGVPHFLKQIQKPGRATRLDLAEWLVARDNPLTARVLVNRLWKMFFGVGLTRTTEDFGAQGESPMHPELLDWLAADLVDHGWDLKRTLRLIVTSATYRQSSVGTPVVDERDPFNRLYARQGRFRLEAEFVRDNALSVSGLLVDRLGGPSVKPWQPPGYWSALNFPRREYEPDRGTNTWRRGVYTHWQRTYLHPALLAFDAPTREECTVNRTVSNTPQQALVLLNDPEFVEMAGAFAARVVRQPGNFEDRLKYAYAQALNRTPRSDEIAVLNALYQKERAAYEADPEAARALVATRSAAAAQAANVVELAAWTLVSRTLLNLHETMTRN